VALKILYVYDLSQYYASSKQKPYKNMKTKMFVTYGKGKLNTKYTRLELGGGQAYDRFGD
jgi:hypothetical protein